MSKARQKGTKWETALLQLLRTSFPTAERAPLKGVHDKGDFLNVPFPIEAKHTKVSRFPEWIRKIREKATDYRWVVAWKGDARTKDGRPVGVVDLQWLLEMVHYCYGEPFGYLVRTEPVDLPNPEYPAYALASPQAQVDNDGNPVDDRRNNYIARGDQESPYSDEDVTEALMAMGWLM